VTKLDAKLTQGLNDLDGFGTFAPIMVRFDGPVDITTIRSDTVFVVNVQPNHPGFGRAVPLDLGPLPAFPVTMERPHAYFTPVEPFASAMDTIFRPGNRVTFYEDETNTLILRVLVPLDEAATHAVVITTGVRGTNGDPVRPPASGIVPGQGASVAKALTALGALGVPSKSVSFAWTFTTESITATPLALADGLHGLGPFAGLAGAYPPVLTKVDDLIVGLDDGDPYTLDVTKLSLALTTLQPLGAALAPVSSIGTAMSLITGLVGSGLDDMDSVKYFVLGSYASPSFLKGGGGRFQVSIAGKTAAQVQDQVTFMACVPRPSAANGYRQPPYPAVIFGHGNGRSRIDAFGISTVLARHGLAAISIDAYGHGPDDAISHLPPKLVALSQQNPALEPLMALGLATFDSVLGISVNPFDPFQTVCQDSFSQGIFAPFMTEGRAIDVDGDGYPDSGANFFDADPTVTRDIIRQTALDTVQLCRILKAFGTDVNGNGHLDRVEGDFHQTGVADIGGPGNPIYYMGQSLGSIVGSQIVALAPEIEAAVLNAAGSGLPDINLRSSYYGVADTLMHISWGMALSGRLDPATGEVVVSVQAEGSYPPVTRLKAAGSSSVVLTNGATGVAHVTTADASGQFFVSVAADRGDPLALVLTDPATGTVQTCSTTAPVYPINGAGMGVVRNTPQWRKYLSVGAMALDEADPVNFARCWRTAPLPGRTPRRVLLQVSRNDWTVPVATGLTLGRAAGFVSPARDDLLRTLGIPYGKVPSTVNVDRDYGVESTRDFGIRVFCVDEHEFLILPNDNLPDGVLYTVAAQEQAAEFFETGVIDDSFPILQR
jgi:hypothetical protein